MEGGQRGAIAQGGRGPRPPGPPPGARLWHGRAFFIFPQSMCKHEQMRIFTKENHTHTYTHTYTHTHAHTHTHMHTHIHTHTHTHTKPIKAQLIHANLIKAQLIHANLIKSNSCHGNQRNKKTINFHCNDIMQGLMPISNT